RARSARVERRVVLERYGQELDALYCPAAVLLDRPPAPFVRQISLLPWLRKKHCVSGKTSSPHPSAVPPAPGSRTRIVIGSAGSGKSRFWPKSEMRAEEVPGRFRARAGPPGHRGGAGPPGPSGDTG